MNKTAVTRRSSFAEQLYDAKSLTYCGVASGDRAVLGLHLLVNADEHTTLIKQIAQIGQVEASSMNAADCFDASFLSEPNFSAEWFPTQPRTARVRCVLGSRPPVIVRD